MSKKIGFLGGGNMASAMISGICKAKLLPAADILVYDHHNSITQKLSGQFNVTIMKSAEQLAASCDILIGAIKPKVMLKVLPALSQHIKADTVLVSVAAGVTLEALGKALGREHKIIRIMPNTPALIGAGMSSVTPNKHVSAEETASVVTIFKSFGEAEVIDESLIHAVVGVSGSAPAYVYVMIEAMADAAVQGGMSRDKAYLFAAQAVKGAAQMVLETGEHPGSLKDKVCSPSGTTIEAVTTLEKQGFRAAIMHAIENCIHKSESMSKQ